MVINPYYFAISSDKTGNSEEVFNKNILYLRIVESPGDEKAKTLGALSQIINYYYINANSTSANFKKEITVIDRTEKSSEKVKKWRSYPRNLG